jgi:hypothetical protein
VVAGTAADCSDEAKYPARAINRPAAQAEKIKHKMMSADALTLHAEENHNKSGTTGSHSWNPTKAAG